MHLKTSHLLALAIGAVTSTSLMAQQSTSNGFVEDSSLNLLSRNLAWYHDRADGGGDTTEWGQGFQLDFASGYTQGPVGFGIDLHAYTAIKLDQSSTQQTAAGVLVVDKQGKAKREASSAGGAVKARFSNTELKYGNVRPYNPVFAPADARLLPSTATGFTLTSSEVDGLFLEAGHMTAAKDFNSTNSDGNFFAAYAGTPFKTADFVGGSYTLNDQLSLSLYGSDYKDVWRQYYSNLNFTQPLSDDQSLNFDFNIYKTSDEGKSLAGEIDTTAWSLAAAYTVGAHTFTLTHQRINGDQPFDYLGMGKGTYHDSIYLANSSQISDFNGPNERSWGAIYNLDLGKLPGGVPGLTFSVRYITGDDVDGSKMDPTSPYNYYGSNEKHWERDVNIKYVVQSGTAKDLSFRLRHGTHRISGNSDVDSDQVRLIVEYPLSIL